MIVSGSWLAMAHATLSGGNQVMALAVCLLIAIIGMHDKAALALTVTSNPRVDIGTDATITCSDLQSFTRLQFRKSDSSVTDVTMAATILEYTYGTSTGSANYGSGFNANHFTFQESAGDYLLTVKSVTLDDGGKYWCYTIKFPPPTDRPSQHSASSIMQIRVPPSSVVVGFDGVSYPDGGTPFPVVAGDGRQFTCNTTGVNPAATFAWTLPTGVTTDQPAGTQTDIPNTGDSRLVDSFNTITVAISENPATSQLMCGATNRQDGMTDSEVEVTVTLLVKVPPKPASMSLHDYRGANLGTTVAIDLGKPQTFSCWVLNTRPAVTTHWYLDGILQHTDSPRDLRADGLFDTISNWTFTPTRANHRQELKCVASTPESQQPFPAVQVTLDISGPPDTPLIAGSKTVTEGELATLSCSATGGFPDDWNLVWSVGGTPIYGPTTSSPAGDRFMFLATLTFTPRREDTGNTITCSAQRGPWTSSPFGFFGPLDVQYSSNITNKEDDAVSVRNGTDAVLICIAKGNPSSSVRWYNPHNAEITNSINQYKYMVVYTVSTSRSNGFYGYVHTSRLIINGVHFDSDTGLYTCTSSNGIGNEDLLKISLIETRTPGTPTNVEITSRTSHSLTVFWMPSSDNFNGDQWFYVSYVTRSNPSSIQENRVTADNTYNVTGLDSYTEYEIRVSTENAFGRNAEYGKTMGFTLRKFWILHSVYIINQGPFDQKMT